jgi:hypothetical protein
MSSDLLDQALTHKRDDAFKGGWLARGVMSPVNCQFDLGPTIAVVECLQMGHIDQRVGYCVNEDCRDASVARVGDRVYLVDVKSCGLLDLIPDFVQQIVGEVMREKLEPIGNLLAEQVQITERAVKHKAKELRVGFGVAKD